MEITNKVRKHSKSQMTSVTDNVIKIALQCTTKDRKLRAIQRERKRSYTAKLPVFTSIAIWQ